MTTDAQGQVEEGQEPETDERPSTQGNEDDNQSTSVMVSLPIGLKARIKQVAESDGETVSAFIRKQIAEAVGYTGPLGQGRRRLKYATEAERVAAQKARVEAKRDLIKRLMATYESELNEQTKAAEEAAVAKVRERGAQQ